MIVKNNKLYATIKLLAFLIAFGLCFVVAQNVLKLKMGHRGTDNVKGFYALDKYSADVLFIGASTAFCTMDPIVLYEEYGITSFDFASSAQPVALSHIYLQEALKTQKPKVVGFEFTTIFNELDINKADELNYGLTDMPLSMTKIRGVMDMFKDDIGIGLSYLIPMVQYKDRWQELERADITPWKDPLTMGAYTPDKISESPLDFSEYYEETETEEIPKDNLETFLKIKEICDQNGIKLVGFKSPNVGWTLGRTKGVADLCEKYDIPFVNFFDLMEELEIDPAVDFRDNTHLNITGSRKTSVYMGEWLKERYELPDERGTQRGSRWQLASDNRKNNGAGM